MCLLKPLNSLPGNDEQTCGHLRQVCKDFPGDVRKAALHVSICHLNVNWSNLCAQALGKPPLLASGFVIMHCKSLNQSGPESYCFRCCVNSKEDIVLFLKNYVPGKGCKQKMGWETGSLKHVKEG